MVVPDDEIFRQMDEDEIRLGGCIVSNADRLDPRRSDPCVVSSPITVTASTVGRHAIDHIMTTLDVIVGCICNIIGRGSVAKGNHGQCTCGAFLYPIPD